jgi:hypothetical protein
MGVNIRTKGAGGEREIADILNGAIYLTYKERGLPYPSSPIVQRNQNQSAVGGQDLVGTFGYAIEIKRQETLNINTWWKQCVASADTLGEEPVLIFRQSREKWRVILNAYAQAPGLSIYTSVRAEITIIDFVRLFRQAVTRALDKSKPFQEIGLFTGS